MPLQDTDILLVNRNGDSFRETFANLRAAVPDGTVTEVTGTSPVSVSNGTTTPNVSVAQGTTSSTGVVQLVDSTSSTSTTTAATPNSVKTAMDRANTANTNADSRVSKAGDTTTGSIRATVRTISNNSTWDLATGDIWHFGGGVIANGSNVVSGRSGLIYVSGAITGFGNQFTNGENPGSFPAVIPYYCNGTNVIRLGNPVEVG